jgi:hypothetical protein
MLNNGTVFSAFEAEAILPYPWPMTIVTNLLNGCKKAET